MPRAAKARVFRSTQTAPNASTVRDLTTGFGSSANQATVVNYAAAGTPSYRFSPGTTGTAVTPPAAPSTAAGMGWRDTVAEDAAEPITYAAGTWTVRTRINKTVMAVNATVSVRVTVVVYKVTSAGVHVAEIGRVVMADTDLPTVGAVVTITGSFTTGAATTFAAGDKIQVEAYIQNVVAGAVVSPTVAYSAAFVVDETSANGASFTAIPQYTIQFARTHAVTGTGVVAMARAITAFRRPAVTAVGTAATARRVALNPKTTTAVGTTAAQRAVALVSKGVTAVGTTAASRAVELNPKTTTAVGSVVMARQTTASRSAAVNAIGTPGFARSIISARGFTVTATSATGARLDIPQAALNRIPPPGGTPDWPLNEPTKVIAGVTRNSTGAVLGGATVKLIRQSDDVRVDTATSDPVTGAYSFTRGGDDPNTYRVLATKADTPEVHGVSDALVPA